MEGGGDFLVRIVVPGGREGKHAAVSPAMRGPRHPWRTVRRA